MINGKAYGKYEILKNLAKTFHIFRRNAMMIVPCMNMPT